MMESITANEPVAGKVVKGFAKIFSYLFHPVFIPIYIFAFIIYIHPVLFAGFTEKQKMSTMLIALLNLVFFPLFSVFLLKALGFISSIYLPTQKDRIIPYIAVGIFYFWAYTVFKQQIEYPRIMPAFILGIFLASSAALLANIYFKVSMHAIGAGGLLGFFLVLIFTNNLTMVWPLAAAILITGIICSSRLLLGEHNQKEIYVGLVLGLVAQVVAGYSVL